MKLARTTKILLALILVLSLTTTTLAILYVTKSPTFSATVRKLGDMWIVAYGTTTPELTNLNFGEFDNWDLTKTYDITIINKGNQPLKLTWQLQAPHTYWEAETADKYQKRVSGSKYWQLEVVDFGTSTFWTPKDLTGINKERTLNVSASLSFTVKLTLKYAGYLASDDLTNVPMDFYGDSLT